MWVQDDVGVWDWPRETNVGLGNLEGRLCSWRKNTRFGFEHVKTEILRDPLEEMSNRWLEIEIRYIFCMF